MILQQEVPNRVKVSRNGIDIITTVFAFGPIRIVVIANIPPDGQEQGTSYVRIELMKSAEWYEFVRPEDRAVHSGQRRAVDE